MKTNPFIKIKIWLLDRFKDSQELAEKKAESAIIVINKLKEAVEDPTVDFLVSLSKTKIDDRLLFIAMSYLPKIAQKLGIAKGILTGSETPMKALYAIISHIRDIPKPGRRGWWIELAAELAGAFIDGNISFQELLALTQMVFSKIKSSK